MAEHRGKGWTYALSYLFVAFPFLPLLLVGHSSATEHEPELLVVRVQALLVSDDDGGRQARATPSQFRRWIGFANGAYRDANVRFQFKASEDWAELRDTVVNNLVGVAAADWREARDHGDAIAAEYPGKLVVFVRHGPGTSPSGGGFSWVDYDFVVMGGFDDMNHCGHPHLDALAHEIGHYLGLPHTFRGRSLPDIAAAEAILKKRDNDPNVFDGDGFNDTLPDPCIKTTECDRKREVTLNGIRYRLPRHNLMSYYDERDSLSGQQIDRLKWILNRRLENRMALPKNHAGADALEVEELRVLSRDRCPTVVQDMQGWGVGNWSSGTQLFCGVEQGGAVTVELPVKADGNYRLIVYATLAPDFGVLECMVDGKPCGTAQDLYGPIVLPSGPLDMYTVTLSKGLHRMTLGSTRKNRLSTGYKLGIDAIELKPEEEVQAKTAKSGAGVPRTSTVGE